METIQEEVVSPPVIPEAAAHVLSAPALQLAVPETALETISDPSPVPVPRAGSLPLPSSRHSTLSPGASARHPSPSPVHLPPIPTPTPPSLLAAQPPLPTGPPPPESTLSEAYEDDFNLSLQTLDSTQTSLAGELSGSARSPKPPPAASKPPIPARIPSRRSVTSASPQQPSAAPGPTAFRSESDVLEELEASGPAAPAPTFTHPPSPQPPPPPQQQQQQAVGDAGPSPAGAPQMVAQLLLRRRHPDVVGTRTEMDVSLITYRHPSSWTGEQVAEFITYIGMGQYRRQFVHNAITGKLLLELSEEDMRKHLSISVLAHHRYIRQTVVEIETAWQEPSARVKGPRGSHWVQEGYMGQTEAAPFLATVDHTAERKRKQLALKIERDAMALKLLEEQAARAWARAEERKKGLLSLKEALTGLERKEAAPKNTRGESTSPIRPRFGGLGVDTSGGLGGGGGGGTWDTVSAASLSTAAAWRPSGAVKSKYSSLSTNELRECTFAPRVSQRSQSLVRGAGTFLTRLERDLQKRSVSASRGPRAASPGPAVPGATTDTVPGAPPIHLARLEAESRKVLHKLRTDRHRDMRRAMLVIHPNAPPSHPAKEAPPPGSARKKSPGKGGAELPPKPAKKEFLPIKKDSEREYVRKMLKAVCEADLPVQATLSTDDPAMSTPFGDDTDAGDEFDFGRTLTPAAATTSPAKRPPRGARTGAIFEDPLAPRADATDAAPPAPPVNLTALMDLLTGHRKKLKLTERHLEQLASRLADIRLGRQSTRTFVPFVAGLFRLTLGPDWTEEKINGALDRVRAKIARRVQRRTEKFVAEEVMRRYAVEIFEGGRLEEDVLKDACENIIKLEKKLAPSMDEDKALSQLRIRSGADLVLFAADRLKVVDFLERLQGETQARKTGLKEVQKKIREQDLAKWKKKNPKGIAPEERYKLDREASALYFGLQLGWCSTGKVSRARLQELEDRAKGGDLKEVRRKMDFVHELLGQMEADLSDKKVDALLLRVQTLQEIEALEFKLQSLRAELADLAITEAEDAEMSAEARQADEDRRVVIAFDLEKALLKKRKLYERFGASNGTAGTPDDLDDCELQNGVPGSLEACYRYLLQCDPTELREIQEGRSKVQKKKKKGDDGPGEEGAGAARKKKERQEEMAALDLPEELRKQLMQDSDEEEEDTEKLDPKRKAKIEKERTERKRVAVYRLIQRQRYVEKVDVDIKRREQRSASAARDPREIERAAKLQEETRHACEYLANAFGWRDAEGVSRERGVALVRRAIAVKRAAVEGAEIDWSTFRDDGLEELERRDGSPGALRKALGLLARENEGELIKMLTEGSGRSIALKVFQVLRWQMWYATKEQRPASARAPGDPQPSTPAGPSSSTARPHSAVGTASSAAAAKGGPSEDLARRLRETRKLFETEFGWADAEGCSAARLDVLLRRGLDFLEARRTKELRGASPEFERLEARERSHGIAGSLDKAAKLLGFASKKELEDLIARVPTPEAKLLRVAKEIKFGAWMAQVDADLQQRNKRLAWH